MYFLWAGKRTFLAIMVIYMDWIGEQSHIQWNQPIGLKAEMNWKKILEQPYNSIF